MSLIATQLLGLVNSYWSMLLTYRVESSTVRRRHRIVATWISLLRGFCRESHSAVARLTVSSHTYRPPAKYISTLSMLKHGGIRLQLAKLGLLRTFRVWVRFNFGFSPPLRSVQQHTWLPNKNYNSVDLCVETLLKILWGQRRKTSF